MTVMVRQPKEEAMTLRKYANGRLRQSEHFTNSLKRSSSRSLTEKKCAAFDLAKRLRQKCGT